MANALVNIQIIPQTPPGADMIPYVDRAIAVIKDSGLPYRVGPLGTTLEGDLQACLEVIATMNQELHQQGCSYSAIASEDFLQCAAWLPPA